MRRNPIYPDINYSDYNNHGLKEYAPYILNDDGNIVIDIKWWESLTNYTKKSIIQKIRSFTIGNVHVPHQDQYDIQGKNMYTDKPLTDIFQSYLDGFDYNIWYDKNCSEYVKYIEIIELNDMEKDTLLKLSEGENSDTESNTIITIKKKIKDSLDVIRSACNNLDIGFFVRLSSTSGKNEKPIQEYLNEHDIFQHLITCDLFRGREYKRNKQVCIIVLPFNQIIESRLEFRMFVIDNRLVAVCQQKWWELFNYYIEELEMFEDCFTAFQTSFIQRNACMYKTFIADVYVDIVEKKCKLIELNPFGAHSGAGSGLFNWITDYDLLHGLKDICEFRYLSLVDV